MKIQPYLKADGTGTIKIYPHKTRAGNVDLFHHIDVYIDEDFLTKKRKAEVNWSGCGSQTPSLAKAYGEGLMKAARLADWVNESIKHQMYGIESGLGGYDKITQEDIDAYWAEKNVVTK